MGGGGERRKGGEAGDLIVESPSKQILFVVRRGGERRRIGAYCKIRRGRFSSNHRANMLRAYFGDPNCMMNNRSLN